MGEEEKACRKIKREIFGGECLKMLFLHPGSNSAVLEEIRLQKTAP